MKTPVTLKTTDHSAILDGILKDMGIKTLFIESFNGKLRDELLNVEIFDTLLEAQVLVERWRDQYNHVRPHSAPGYRPPAPENTLNSAGPAKFSPLSTRSRNW